MPREDKGLRPGTPIPSFSLEDVKGQTYTAEQLQGRPFLLYFLRGTW
jgi:peroxiredoxin